MTPPCHRCDGAGKVTASSCDLPPGGEVACPACRPGQHERDAGVVRAIARHGEANL